MIKKPLHLIFALQVYKSLVSLEEEEKFLAKNHLVIKENWHCFKVILGLFRVTEI